jgi:hypothetical protein
LEGHPLVEHGSDIMSRSVKILREAAEHAGPVGEKAGIEGLAGEPTGAEVFVEENTHKVW